MTLKFTVNARVTGEELYWQLLCAKSMEKYLGWSLTTLDGLRDLDSKLSESGQNQLIDNNTTSRDRNRLRSGLAHFILFLFPARKYLRISSSLLEFYYRKVRRESNLVLNRLPNFLMTDPKLSANLFYRKGIKVEKGQSNLKSILNLMSVESSQWINSFQQHIRYLELIRRLPELAAIQTIEIAVIVDGAMESYPEAKVDLQNYLEDSQVKFYRIKIRTTENCATKARIVSQTNLFVLGAQTTPLELYFAYLSGSALVFADSHCNPKLSQIPLLIVA